MPIQWDEPPMISHAADVPLADANSSTILSAGMEREINYIVGETVEVLQVQISSQMDKIEEVLVQQKQNEICFRNTIKDLDNVNQHVMFIESSLSEKLMENEEVSKRALKSVNDASNLQKKTAIMQEKVSLELESLELRLARLEKNRISTQTAIEVVTEATQCGLTKSADIFECQEEGSAVVLHPGLYLGHNNSDFEKSVEADDPPVSKDPTTTSPNDVGMPGLGQFEAEEVITPDYYELDEDTHRSPDMSLWDEIGLVEPAIYASGKVDQCLLPRFEEDGVVCDEIPESYTDRFGRLEVDCADKKIPSTIAHAQALIRGDIVDVVQESAIRSKYKMYFLKRRNAILPHISSRLAVLVICWLGVIILMQLVFKFAAFGSEPKQPNWRVRRHKRVTGAGLNVYSRR